MRAGARPPRGVVVALCIGVALLIAALVGGRPGRDGPPLDPRSDGPLGTSALVALLRGVGAEVDLSVGAPGVRDDTALVLRDRLDSDQAEDLMRWVDQGGTLVVTDPSSPLVPAPADRALGSELGLDDGEIGPGRCTIDALATIGPVDGGDPVRFDADAGDRSCFGDGDRAFVVTRAVGLGTVVAVGGAAFVTNDLLDEVDNAVLAATLLAPSPDTVVRFVEAPVPAGGGDKTLADLVPPGVKRALLQLGVAFVLYALWRAIRFGQPVVEDQPVDVASSELVGAIGRLLSRSGEPETVAEMLRSDLRRRLRARLGVPRDAPLSALIEITAARTGLPVEQVRAAVDERPVTSEAELVAAARAVASVHQEVPQ